MFHIDPQRAGFGLPQSPRLLTQHDRSRIEGRIAAGQYLRVSHLASEWALSQELAQRLFQ